VNHSRFFLLILLTLGLGCRKVVRTSHDVIYFTSGEEAIGSLHRISKDSVWFHTEEGLKVFDRSEVASIDLPQPREGESWQTVKDIKDTELKKALAIAASIPPTDVRYINLYVEHEFQLTAKNKLKHRRRVIRYVTAESGKGQAANNTWFYLADQGYGKVDFARSVNPEGMVTHINEAAINRTSRFPAPSEYSNLMQIQIAVPESRVGSVLDFQFTTYQEIVDSLHPVFSEIVLGGSEPTMMEIIKVIQPVNGPLKVYASDKSRPERSRKGNLEVLTWKVQNQPPLRFERMTPPRADYLKRFIVAEAETWHEVAGNLRIRYEEASKPGEKIPALVDSLTSGLLTSGEKAQALYEFVSSSIRSVGPSMNNYSYIPTPAEDVLSRRFANNLDRNLLLYSLMLHAGLEADLVLIRSREAGRLVAEFATLGQLNYAMVLFEDRVFLDPLPDVPFGTLSEQDVMGVVLSTGKLKEVELKPASLEQGVTDARARLASDGTLAISLDVSFTGQLSAAWKSYLKILSPPELRQEAEELAASVHPNATLIAFEFTGTESLNQEAGYSLKLNIPDYATKAGDYFILYLPGVDHSAYSVGATERLYPIDRLTLSESILNVELKLPKGADLMYYPEDVLLETDQDSYSAVFTNPDSRTITFTETSVVTKPMIPPQDYTGYKNLVEGMARLSQEPIVLKLK